MAQVLKILGQAAPGATSETDLYTVPADTEAAVSSVYACNRSTGSAKVRVSVSADGGATANKDYLYYDVEIPANDTFVATVGLSLDAADVIRVYTDVNTVSFSAYGAEKSAGGGGGGGGPTFANVISLYTPTASAIVTNTTTETTLIGTGVGSLILTAGTLTAGKSIRIFAVGTYHDQSEAGAGGGRPDLTLKVKLNSTLLGITDDPSTLSDTSASPYWRMMSFITVRSTGATGSIFAQAFWEGESGDSQNLTNTAPTTIDTTIDQTIDFTAQWGTGVTADENITCTNMTIEILNTT